MLAKSSVMHPPGLALERVSYFRAPRQSQVHPVVMAAGEERVELVMGGRGWIEDGDAWREVGAGDLIWNGPGDSTIGRNDPANPYECLAVTFRMRPRRGSGTARFSRWEEPEEAALLSARVLQWFADETFDRALLGDYLFHRLRLQVGLDQRRQKRQQLATPLQRVLDLMERDFARPLRLAVLAREAGWSVAHLHQVFRAGVGVPPHQWLLARRLRAARERLISGDQAMKRIAVECGFADSAALAHAFRKRFGLSPKAYRQRHQRGAD